MGERSDRLKEVIDEKEEKKRQVGCGSCEKRRSNLQYARYKSVPYSPNGMEFEAMTSTKLV